MRAKQGLLRTRRTIDGPQGPRIHINGRDALNFCSNDYLGLSNHPSLIAAMKQGLDQYGLGSGSSQLVCGHSRAHQMLEERLAEFTNRERALVFATGYMANLALVNAMIDSSGVVIADRLIHASLIDAVFLSGAKLQRYPHADPTAMQAMLEKTAGAGRNQLVITEAVFSMDGDLAPIPEIAAVCVSKHILLMIDDAHGFGVLGSGVRVRLNILAWMRRACLSSWPPLVRPWAPLAPSSLARGG
jgi:7-keto-8-aminopelargonate synthetase and related enzymes